MDEPAKVHYCIPLWLRNEQIRVNTARPVGRIRPIEEPRPDPVAVVGFGPSLKDTWEQIRPFRYVISCSGAHKFLVERGIIPTWHVEVDPREHKIALIGEPQRETEYLIASACHPKLFDHLSGYTVKLWHVYDMSDDGWHLLPPGEWAITGGCDVGLRAMTIASFLGFRDLHVFGMDGCARERKHAAEHPNAIHEFSECEYDGVVYLTTPGMLEAARQVWHELDQMPKVRATFYGQGLIQHMAKHYTPNHNVRAHPLTNIVGFAKPELISAEYRDLNVRLHRENLAYGVGGGRHADTVLKLITVLKTHSVLDYGCGKGYLAKELANRGIPIWEYDPAIPEKSASPRPADLVVCTDVLEHIEPDKLLSVLQDLRRVTRKIGYFVIHTGPAQKLLPDGRNTHLIQQGRAWWEVQLAQFFVIGKVIERGLELHIVVGPKRKAMKVAA